MVYYITGGQRSGKSKYGQRLALKLSNQPIYLATARKWDSDFQTRIDRHQQDRDERWEDLEEEKNISKFNFEGRVVLLDCITLWLTNFFVDESNDVERCLSLAKAELDLLLLQRATFIIISNEIGMGTHAHTDMGRKFVDLQGWMNQYLAEKSDKVIFMVSGIPTQLK